jgi:hypothetical protein
MKKLILIIAIMGFFAGSYAQSLMPAEVPAKIYKSFEKSHRDINPVDWSKTGDDYKASYNENDRNIVLIYAANGKLKETEKEISLSQLPATVLKYVNDNYPGGVVKRKVMITGLNGKSSYEVQVNQVDLAFNSKGMLVEHMPE